MWDLNSGFGLFLRFLLYVLLFIYLFIYLKIVIFFIILRKKSSSIEVSCRTYLYESVYENVPVTTL